MTEQHSARQKVRLTAVSRLWRWLAAALLAVPGVVLFVFAALLGQNGGQLALVPALVCLLIAAALVLSRSKWATALSVVAAGAVLLLMYALNDACVVCN